MRKSRPSKSTLITMKDGRKVRFAPRAKVVREIIEADSAVRINFRNGEDHTYIVHPENHAALALQGAYALFARVTPRNIESTIAQIYNGQFATTRRTGANLSGLSVLHRALAEHYGKTAAEVATFLEGLSQTEKLALRRSEPLAAVIARLEAKSRAKRPTIDPAALLARLAPP